MQNDDKHFTGNKEAIKNCNYVGVTTNNPHTNATKLYAPFRPFSLETDQWIKLGIQRGFYGKDTKIVEISEKSILRGNNLMGTLRIPSEYSGSVGLGMFDEMKESIRKDAKILIINTGSAKFN